MPNINFLIRVFKKGVGDTIGHVSAENLITNAYISWTGKQGGQAMARYTRNDIPGLEGKLISFDKREGEFANKNHDHIKYDNPFTTFVITLPNAQQNTEKALSIPYYQLANSKKNIDDANNCVHAVKRYLMDSTSDKELKERILNLDPTVDGFCNGLKTL